MEILAVCSSGFGAVIYIIFLGHVFLQYALTSLVLQFHLSFLFQSGTLMVRVSCCCWCASHSAADCH